MNDDRLSGPEAAPTQGGDPQATEQAAWQELRTNLGLTEGEAEVTAGVPGLRPTLAAAQTPTGPAAAGTAPQGSEVDVLPAVRKFYQDLIRRPTGLPPGVVADFKPDPPPAEDESDPELPSDSENATLILDLALRYQGVPYRWGGANRGGVDCSGLIIRAAADGGKPGLPHSAAELWKIGTRIDKSEMKPGDLVFFKNTYKRGISHVGIFAGGSKFLHASSGKKRVTTGNLNDPYFIKHWAGARRWDFLAKKQPAMKKTRK